MTNLPPLGLIDVYAATLPTLPWAHQLGLLAPIIPINVQPSSSIAPCLYWFAWVEQVLSAVRGWKPHTLLERRLAGRYIASIAPLY